eukprot:6072291-Amphidinium_carterae.1
MSVTRVVCLAVEVAKKEMDKNSACAQPPALLCERSRVGLDWLNLPLEDELRAVPCSLPTGRIASTQSYSQLLIKFDVNKRFGLLVCRADAYRGISIRWHADPQLSADCAGMPAITSTVEFDTIAREWRCAASQPVPIS